VAQRFNAAVNALQSVKALAAEVAAYCWTFASHAKNPDPTPSLVTTTNQQNGGESELAPPLP